MAVTREDIGDLRTMLALILNRDKAEAILVRIEELDRRILDVERREEELTRRTLKTDEAQQAAAALAIEANEKLTVATQRAAELDRREAQLAKNEHEFEERRRASEREAIDRINALRVQRQLLEIKKAQTEAMANGLVEREDRLNRLRDA